MRRNPVGIQMIPESIRNSLFHKKPFIHKPILEKSIQHLKEHDLFGKTSPPLPEHSFMIPALAKRSKSIEQHFMTIGHEQQHTWLQRAQSLSQNLLSGPKEWKIQPGWTKYTHNKTESIQELPKGEDLVFDVEVMYNLSPYPVIAVGGSPNAWYCWISPDFLLDKIPNQLIKLGSPDSERLIVGHNISYDRARIQDEYRLKPTKFKFMDTISLHSAVGGLSNQQRALWIMHQNDSNAMLKDWEKKSSLNGLEHVAKLYLSKTIDKSMRDAFSTTDMSIIRSQIQELIHYCATDVDITHQVYQKLLPRFLEKCPHPVSFAGMLHMGSPYLPTRSLLWREYLENAESKFAEYQQQIEEQLMTAVTKAMEQFENKTHMDDPWLSQLDWTVKELKMTTEKVIKGVVQPSRPYKNTNMDLVGKPQWLIDLWSKPLKRFKVSTSKKCVPYLLKLKWAGHPISYNSEFGWIYRTPKTSDPKALKIEDTEYSYFRLPHPDGSLNVGNPLAKSFIKHFESGTLTSDLVSAMDIMQKQSKCIYWISARNRIQSQFLVSDPKYIGTQQKDDVAVILPQTIPMGTVTRRSIDPLWAAAANSRENDIGSEVKSKITAPPDHFFVGADVDSQELWIASLMGDAQFGMAGATAVGFMTLQGSKAQGTDMHSVTGKLANISRDEAKTFNYGRIYGAGKKHALQLLMQNNPSLSAKEGQKTIDYLYERTKGTRRRSTNPVWCGGSESFMFNSLEKVALGDECKTPALGCEIPDSLHKSNVENDFVTTRVNWVVQSSGVDYLHLLLVSMNYLMRRMRIDGRFSISIHDEVRFLIHSKHVEKAVLALQISHLWTRAMFSSRLGIYDLPLSVAFFSNIDIDTCLRKEVYLDCLTPSNKEPVPSGRAMNVQEIMKYFEGKEKQAVFGSELKTAELVEYKPETIKTETIGRRLTALKKQMALDYNSFE